MVDATECDLDINQRDLPSLMNQTQISSIVNVQVHLWNNPDVPQQIS